MAFFLTGPWLRVLSAVFANLGASWLAVAFVAPAFPAFAGVGTWLLLTRYLLSAILCIVVAVKIESILET